MIDIDEKTFDEIYVSTKAQSEKLINDYYVSLGAMKMLDHLKNVSSELVKRKENGKQSECSAESRTFSGATGALR